MPTTVITSETSSAPENPVEAPAETVADAAVEIAEIEANRDIRLAEIHTESNEAQMEAVLEAAAEAEADETDLTLEGIDECRRNIETLATAQTEMQGMLSSILDRLPPPPPPAPNPESASAEGPQEAEAPPAPPPPKRKKSRWI